MAANSSLTQACVPADWQGWHQGCRWCAVWVVALDAPAVGAALAAAVAQQVAQARSVLGDVVWPGYARQPHITLAYRGLLDDSPVHPATEFTAADLQRDIARLRHAAPQPWSVVLQGVGSFNTVPYVAVAAGQAALCAVHQALVPVAGGDGRDGAYVPHVTLGHYARTLPQCDVLAQLTQAGVAAEPITVLVRQLHLLRYAAADMAGPLEVEGCYDLQTQQYLPAPGAVLTVS